MVEKAIDFTRVDPVPYKKTIAFVNNFILNTSQFLNRFSYICEAKLCDVSRQIQRLEITMNILDAKLASISDIGHITASDQPTPSSTTPSSTIPTPPPPQPPGGGPPPPPGAPPPPPPPGPPGPGEAASGGMTYQTDPRFTKYFKMFRMGVPAAHVRNKMMMEGVNPDILDTPDAPSQGEGDGPPAPNQTQDAAENEEEEEEEAFDDD